MTTYKVTKAQAEGHKQGTGVQTMHPKEPNPTDPENQQDLTAGLQHGAGNPFEAHPELKDKPGLDGQSPDNPNGARPEDLSIQQAQEQIADLEQSNPDIAHQLTLNPTIEQKLNPEKVLQSQPKHTMSPKPPGA